jgi:beta-N-acetylhexosaminidase
MGSYLPDEIMTAHILYRKLDDRFPASIFKKVIHDLLRKELGFKGLVISDCLEMDALTRAYSLAGAVIFAVQASCDILTVSHSFGRQLIVRNSLLDAAKNDAAFLHSVDEAVERILKYKEKYCREMKPEIDSEKNREIAEAASLASITIASGEPFRIDENTVAVGVTNYVSSIAEDKNVEDLDIAEILGEEFKIPHLSIDNKNFNVNDVQEFAKGKKVVLALSDSHLTLVQRVLYSNLLQSGARVMLISLRTPYDVLGQALPECHICIYEYTRQSVKALLKVLRGAKAEGKLPVKLGTSPDQSELKNYLVERIVKFIEQNCAKPLTLDVLANEFYLSPGYLCRLFKQKVGINFIDYLNTVRIARAKHLLLTTNLRIYEVGNLCGYADLNYFTKVFKKATGVTPSYFRNNSGYYD